MPPFNRKTGNNSLLPSDIVPRMEYYGRFEFAPHESAPDAPEKINELVIQPLYPIASGNADMFVSQLAEAVLPVGGWALYGGERCVRDLVGMQTRHPGFLAMIDAAMEFLRHTGYGLDRVAPYELEAWRELHPGEAW